MHDSTNPNQILQTEIPTQKSQTRILLWDIDGTLLRSTVQGGYKKYFAATMKKVFGSAGNLDETSPAGMTDSQIMFEALRGENFTIEQIFARKEELLKVFEREMKSVLANEDEPYEILAGVREILAETAKNPIFINALLTGNFSVAAKIKLESIGVWQYFADAPNAFGEISHKRAELAHAAGRLFNQRYDYNFDPQQFIVIGDTPNDIACARDFGAKAIAVETGRGVSREELVESKPDYLLEDLSDTRKVLEVLANL